MSPAIRLTLLAATLASAFSTHAAPVQVTVTVQNLAGANSVSFAPLHVGFGNGSFDAFNNGQAAAAGIVSVAEGGSGTVWQSDFAAAEPLATRGTIGGLLQPGGSASAVFTVDPTINPFFTFGSMVVPSNDFFIGNDNPMQYRLFDAAGNLLISAIDQLASDIWDAGSEAFDPAAAAFVGNNDLRTPQNGVVSFNFAELAGFDGLTTGAGYVFQSGLTANSPIYRISFDVQQTVAEPASLALAALSLAAGFGVPAWRRRKLHAGVKLGALAA
jgi:hypothetical protein